MLKNVTAALLIWCTTFCSAQGVITRFRHIPLSAASGGPPTFVQACDATDWSSTGTGASCVLTSVAAGDVLVIGSQGPAGATVTVNGNALATPIDSAKSDTVRVWLYPNTGSGNNPIVIQQTATGSTHLFVAEFGGVGSSPLDDHVVGVCDGTCPYLGPIATPNLTLSGNDMIWTWCATDFGGYTATLSTTPESSTRISQSQGIGYDEGYRVHAAAGTTYSQCDQLQNGFVVAVAIKGS